MLNSNILMSNWSPVDLWAILNEPQPAPSINTHLSDRCIGLIDNNGRFDYVILAHNCAVKFYCFLRIVNKNSDMRECSWICAHDNPSLKN
jgi:hypothetical protein